LSKKYSDPFKSGLFNAPWVEAGTG